jgi:DNA-binding NarL/FixJ family response regulator
MLDGTDVPPAAQKNCWGGNMAIAIQTISSHPLLGRAVKEVFAHLEDFAVLPSASDETEAMGEGSSPRLFLLDGCSLKTDLGRLAQRCRVRSSGSKFLVLLPANSSSVEKIRLFSWGIDGFVELHETWQAELPVAIRSILDGQPWVPSDVLSAFVKQTRLLLHMQLLPGHSLTSREGQVIQLLIRHLTNKEISHVLGISERTVKFHVSNILGKFGLEDRHGLLQALTSGSSFVGAPAMSVS